MLSFNDYWTISESLFSNFGSLGVVSPNVINLDEKKKHMDAEAGEDEVKVDVEKDAEAGDDNENGVEDKDEKDTKTKCSCQDKEAPKGDDEKEDSEKVEPISFCKKCSKKMKKEEFEPVSDVDSIPVSDFYKSMSDIYGNHNNYGYTPVEQGDEDPIYQSLKSQLPADLLIPESKLKEKSL